jgi:hypothetical protein
LEYFFAYNKKFEQDDRQYAPEDYPFIELVKQYARKNDFSIPAMALDQNIYALRKFFKLAADCNPNILSILFAHDSDVLLCDEIAEELRANNEAFLSAKVRHTYSGYAVSQLKRINTHRRWLLQPPDHKPTRDEYGLPERSVIPADQREAAEKLVNGYMREWLLLEDEVDRSLLSTIHNRLSDFIATLKTEKDLMETARLAAMKKLGMTDNFIAVLQAEKAYRAAQREWKQYQEWIQNRNPARADLESKYGYDAKHTYHLVRLLRMAKEILTTGEVIVKRPDAAELREIRNGAWSFDYLIGWTEEQDKELNEIYKEKKYVVPHKPNVKFLSNLCVQLHKKARGIWKLKAQSS